MSEDVIDVGSVDWNRVWQARNSRRTPPKRGVEFWDGRAASFAEARAETSYATRFLTIMNPQADWTVLDMGCGGGTLAVPLARSVSSVTAVDVSREMLAVVHTRCEEEGISNVMTLQGRWEDDWARLGIGIHDVAIASRSMVGEDLRASILKLDQAARKGVYIVTVVGDDPYDRRLFDAIGRPLNCGADYIYSYNMLYQMGILANVAFIEESRNRAYDSPEKAHASVRWMFGELDSAEEERLRAYVRENLVIREGCWSFCYDTMIRWAVIWWQKE